MSEELLKLADDWLAPRMVPSTPYLLIRDLAARVRELEVERMTHGNVMGRIALALFSEKNNRTDEECVAKVAETVYERDNLRKHLHDEHQRHVLTMDERDALLALLRECHDRFVDAYGPDGRFTRKIGAAIDAARKEGEG